MPRKLGVRFSPRFLEDLVRIGAKVSGDKGFAVRLVENGIPENFRLVNHGVDRETGEIFLVFSESGKQISDPVQWQAPVYEREKEASDGTTP